MRRAPSWSCRDMLLRRRRRECVMAAPVLPVHEAWQGFAGERWRHEIDVRDFIQHNYTPYAGNSAFLSGPTARTKLLWDNVAALFAEERRRGGIYDVDARTPAAITAHAPGYIDRERELVVGLQTDAPLKRAIMPFGGL